MHVNIHGDLPNVIAENSMSCTFILFRHNSLRLVSGADMVAYCREKELEFRLSVIKFFPLRCLALLRVTIIPLIRFMNIELYYIS